MPPRPLASILSLGTALSLAWPAVLSAQAVDGRVVAGTEETPVPGALVTLLDPAGAAVARTVSGRDGSFRLEAPGAAAYRVTGEAPGHATAAADLVVGTEGARTLLRAAPRPPDVDLPRRRADASCRISREESERIALLWTEAAKALRAADWAERSGTLALESATWYRELEPRTLRVVEESRTPRAGFHATARPASPSARELTSRGFVQGGAPGESLAFHAPDAATLADPVFAETHCLGFEPEAPREEWVGLTFAPLDREAREVEGVLWIEAATGAPAHLEFRYTTLPWPVKTDKVGGGMEVERLDGGGWIVSRWWLRMPRVGVREERVTQWDAPHRRYTLTGVVEEGGEILRVRRADGRIEVLSPP